VGTGFLREVLALLEEDVLAAPEGQGLGDGSRGLHSTKGFARAF
jgi:hypothetical protein